MSTGSFCFRHHQIVSKDLIENSFEVFRDWRARKDVFLAQTAPLFLDEDPSRAESVILATE
jgi:hypothetical protein